MSAYYQFAIRMILHPQRTAGMRAATAASELLGERRLWAVRDGHERARYQECCIYPDGPCEP
ncbi:MAG: hypothetical protein AAFQ38_16635 [Pseudomonadota bacterium]